MKEIRNTFGTWDDFSVPASLQRQGATTKPDFDYTNMGLLFPQNDATEIVYMVAQMQHRKALGSLIAPHIHYIQTGASVPVFKLDYRWYNNGSAVPGTWTTISTADGAGIVFPYTSGSILQILPFPDIAAISNEAISSNLEMKLYRDDNVISGDVLVKYFDFHFQNDGSGSKQEYTKWS